MKELITDLCEFLVLILIVVVFIALIMLPVAWLDGHAKSAWLKKSQGVEIPWYQATFLDVTINNQDVKLHNQ